MSQQEAPVHNNYKQDLIRKADKFSNLLQFFFAHTQLSSLNPHKTTETAKQSLLTI
jgi:hypothetical protein